MFVILDNKGWYYDVTNVFICERQIQIVTWKIVIKMEESLNFVEQI